MFGEHVKTTDEFPLEQLEIVENFLNNECLFTMSSIHLLNKSGDDLHKKYRLALCEDVLLDLRDYVREVIQLKKEN